MPQLPSQKRHHVRLFLALIVGLALFLRLYNLTSQSGAGQVDMILVLNAFIGVVSVLVFYVFIKYLLGNNGIALLSAFLMSVSAWHLNLSRSLNWGSLALLCLLLSWIFLLRALSTASLSEYALSGLLIGLSAYIFWWLWLGLLPMILAVLAYGRTIKRDFGHEKYLGARSKILRGLALLVVIAGFCLLTFQFSRLTSGRMSLAIYLDRSHGDVIDNVVTGLGFDQFSNYSGSLTLPNSLYWPLGILALVGLGRSIMKLINRYHKHRHFSTIEVFILSWFVVGAFVGSSGSSSGPITTAIFLLAPLTLFAAEALWWLYEFIKRWNSESSASVTNLTFAIFLAAITLSEIHRYFIF